MAQDRLTMTFLFCRPYDIIIWAGQSDGVKIVPGGSVLLIDDLITKADSKFESINVLESAGLKVENIMVVIDREQGGYDELKKAGYLLHSIFKITELLDFYLDNKKISREKYSETINYINANKQ